MSAHHILELKVVPRVRPHQPRHRPVGRLEERHRPLVERELDPQDPEAVRHCRTRDGPATPATYKSVTGGTCGVRGEREDCWEREKTDISSLGHGALVERELDPQDPEPVRHRGTRDGPVYPEACNRQEWGGVGGHAEAGGRGGRTLEQLSRGLATCRPDQNLHELHDSRGAFPVAHQGLRVTHSS
jgi:hypothetical protein